MKMLIIGFVALACMGANKINTEFYLAGAKEMLIEPLDQQRRIGKIDLNGLTDKKFKKDNIIKHENSISAIRKPIDFNPLMISRFFNVAGIHSPSMEDKQVFSKTSKVAEGPAGKEGVIDQLIWFFDTYGIPGGIVIIILLFASIRFHPKGSTSSRYFKRKKK